MRRVGTVLLIVAVSVEGLAIVLLVVALQVSRRRHRVARGELARLRTPPEKPPRRLVPTSREVVRGVWETAALVREQGLGGALRTSIDELAGWAQVERPDLVRLAGPEGTLSILFSDIEGSTALNEELGDGTVLLTVRDSGQWRERVPSMDRGRGSTLMSAFADVTATPGPDGTTVTIRVPRTADPARRPGA